MSEKRQWPFHVMLVGTGLAGVAVTAGLAAIANRFVDEFTRPHFPLDQSEFEWEIQEITEEPPSSQQRTVWFQTRDGMLLNGEFWRQDRVVPTVVMCHGYRVSRAQLRSAASILYQQGFNIFLFDFRGHGASESVYTSAGKVEVRDLEAALAVAKLQPETRAGQLVVYGFSMGAAVALLTPPDPDVRAIIADSPYASSDEVLQRLVCYRLSESVIWKPFLWVRSFFFILAWLIVWMGASIFWLRYRYMFVARPVATFHKKQRWQREEKPLGHTPLLLIHCSGDTMIPIEQTRQIIDAATAEGVPLETYLVEGGGHCTAYVMKPDEYTATLMSFLTKHLS